MVVCLEHWLQELWVLHIRTGLQLEDRLKTAVFHSFYMMKKAKHIMLKDLMILPILKMRTDYFVNILEVDFLRKNRI